MQVVEPVHLRRANQEKMHQVAVIGDQRGHHRFWAANVPVGFADAQFHFVVRGERHLQFRRLINHGARLGRCGVRPPQSAERENPDHTDKSAKHYQARAALLPRARLFAGFELSFAPGGADNRNESGHEQNHQPEEERAKFFLHRERVASGRGYGHCDRAGTLVAIGFDANLPRARFHQPDFPCEELRVAARRLKNVGRRRVFRPGADNEQRSDFELADASLVAADFNLRNAGNHLRRADHHHQMVRTGFALKVDVRAANVCDAGGSDRDGEKQ